MKTVQANACTSRSTSDFKTGDRAMISPDRTGLNDWLEGTIVDVENNSFNGIVLTVKSDDGRMFFGQLCFFKHTK